MDIPQGMWDSDDSDLIVEKLIQQYDGTSMPLPNIESQPHLLISKVRKHYMEYLIKLLAMNYETNQRLLNKNIYLPSAIWRCAKNIEAASAQMCMVVQLYRQHIVNAINELKNDTRKGRLNKKLYECLHIPPENEKKCQTTLIPTESCNCECRCKFKTKRRKAAPLSTHLPPPAQDSVSEVKHMPTGNMPSDFKTEYCQIPVLINSQVDELGSSMTHPNNDQLKPESVQYSIFTAPSVRMSVESQDSDDLMLQLEQLFQGDPNDEDLFDGALCDTMESYTNDDSGNKHKAASSKATESGVVAENIESAIAQSHSLSTPHNKTLDERLASLAGLLTSENNVPQTKPDTHKNKKPHTSTGKWLCEEFFLRSRLFDLLDVIGDLNRKKLTRIKETLLSLFGADSDDEGLVSPLDETPELVISCKERIAPWVVKLLTPYYIKGRIRGKTLFKTLAKHLIKLIYQCSNYPSEYEVKSFVTDFLESHKMIRCEADFKQFRIENL